jgi:hypothetical protein
MHRLQARVDVTEAILTDAPRKLVLLVVDDEVLVANMIADQLGDLGYMVAGPVYTLKDGQDGALIDVNLGRGTLSSPKFSLA